MLLSSVTTYITSYWNEVFTYSKFAFNCGVVESIQIRYIKLQDESNRQLF